MHFRRVWARGFWRVAGSKEGLRRIQFWKVEALKQSLDARNPEETTQGMTQSEQQVQQTANELEMQLARPKALTDWMKWGVWAAS